MNPVVLFWPGLSLFAVALLAPLPFLRRTNTRARHVSLFSQIAGSLAFLGLSISILISNQPFQVRAYELAPDFAFAFLVDRLAAFFIFLICAVALAAGIYSLRYGDHDPGARQNLLASMMGFFVLSMILVVASDNTFSLLFFWETMSVSSFVLVMFEYRDKLAQKSGLFYFIMTQMSTVFLIFAFLLMYSVNGSFATQRLDGVSEGLKGVLFISLFVGFSIKAGVIPFHKWLPYAHSASPSNISALMSGVMIKVAIYGMLRFVLFVLEPELWHGILILVFGSVSALLGVIYALKEHDLKKLLAYCSVENVGTILLGVGLSIVFAAYNLPDLALLALAGGLFHTLNHALFKGLLFLTAGSVAHETGTRNIEEMGGLVKRMPVTAAMFLIGAASIAALPPFNGFVSELMIFQAFFQSFRIAEPFVGILLFVALAMFALTSALAAACFVKAFGTVFLAMPRSRKAERAKEVPRAMLIGPAILAALCVILGIFSFQIFAAAGFQLNTPDLLPAGLVMLGFLGLTILVVRITANRSVRTSETWGCGLTSQNSKMEYTASGFSEPILTIFRPIYRTTRVSQRLFADKFKAIVSGGTADIQTFKIFEEKIYMPLAKLVYRFSDKVAEAQDVDLDDHILYAFIAILVMLALAWWVL